MCLKFSGTDGLSNMECFTLSLLGLAILLLVLAFAKFMSASHDTFHKMGIDTPPTSLILGHFGLSVKFGVFKVQTEFYKMFKDKKVYGWYDTRTPILVIKDLDMVKEIMVKSFNHFIDRRVPMEHDLPFRDNLLTLRGSKWKHVRSTVSPTFSSGRIKKMSPHVERNAKKLMKHLQSKQESGEELELKELCGCFTLDVIASIAFGLEINALEDPDNKFSTEAKRITRPNLLLFALILFFPELGNIFSRLGLPIFPKSSMQYMANVIDAAIEERKRDGSEGKFNDFLDLVMSAEKEDGEAIKERLTRSEIHAQSIIFLFAGLDSVSTVMSFTLFLLAVHPECCKKAQAEVDEKIGKDFPNYENVQGLNYLEMCISEAIRMAPPGIFIDRQCVEAIDVQGVHIPKGMVVLIPVYAIHNDPDLWPEPEKFDPERFSSVNKESRHPYAFLPFGHGPRNCIGMRLAMLELKITIAAVLQRFSPISCSKTVFPFQLTKIQARAVDGAWVKIEGRQ
ncbi:unnamed protein product [Lymnaea stagnalis]|uniref:Cytochrome P450 n=1 Tax=Lymnaea stagnalis TaxID=6523 RepID=A0AAV2H719_LYMST